MFGIIDKIFGVIKTGRVFITAFKRSLIQFGDIRRMLNIAI